MPNITIINGPNLNLLGMREPGVYGNETFDDFFAQLKKDFPQVNFTYFQSNIEGELVNAIQQYGFNQDGII
jgi:3-dehydroquinate dehydratase II